jgi:multisubunit Na+/H+ antiporter MnhF subunit
MIDSWLFATLCLSFLSACAFLRVIPGPSLFDRLVAAMAGITLAAAAALVLTIAWGDLFILDAAIVLVLLLYAAVIAIAQFYRGAPA